VTTRYRCSACGNQTRFDVVMSRRTRAFHHFTVAGELQVEDEVVLQESVDDVTCRWCGTGASISVIEHEVEGTLVASQARTSRAAEAAGET
jgi:hypothetical protein